MLFKIQTGYSHKALTAMAKALRKTTRTAKSRRTRIFGVLVIVFALFLTLPKSGEPFNVDMKMILTWTVVLIMILAFVFEDTLNGYVAKKRLLPGMTEAETTFYEDHYCTLTNVGKSEFSYGNITDIAETEEYFVFLFGKNHAQVYEKKSITGGTESAFGAFIEKATGKKIINLSARTKK
ncbi:MAG: YcxB family protein [Clostridia bacterium]|nr:YcxB family protein [Clostridia bacterium]